MKIKLFFAAISALSLFSCSERNAGVELAVVRHAHLADLPSASGIEYANNSIFITGDDLRWLVTLDSTWHITDSLALSAVDTIVNNRTPGNIKADFESIAKFAYNSNEYLLVLSSGSKAVTRDTAHLVNITDNTIARKNTRDLYDKIKSLAGISADDEINIEGLAVSSHTAFLFHRGNIHENFLVAMSLDALMNYLLKESTPPPELKPYKFQLPEHEGVPAGFSGACLVPGSNGILFTASLEDTESALADGAILGSYIGYIPFKDLENGIIYSALLTDDEGNPVKTKLESIVVKSVSGNKVTAFTVSDNDDGSSDIFEIKITLNDLL